MFLNFVVILFYYKIYNLLIEKDLLKKYSPKDVLLHLLIVHKIKIGDNWVTSEIPRKTKQIIGRLDRCIT